jgi:hypothetical protein
LQQKSLDDANLIATVMPCSDSIGILGGCVSVGACGGYMFRFCTSFVMAIVFWSPLWGQDKQFTDDWMSRANSPGSILKLKETGRSAVQGRTLVSYRLFASGLPERQHFTLWMWNLGTQPQAAADAYINADGLVVNSLGDATHKEDPIDLRTFAGRGEPKRFALTSDDWKLQAFAEAVPFPMEQSSNGCKLSVETYAPDYSAVVLRGSGFQPNEALAIDVGSGAEGSKQQAIATPEGTYTAVIAPAVKGQKSGKASASITSSKCSVAVEFPWGEGSYKIQ